VNIIRSKVLVLFVLAMSLPLVLLSTPYIQRVLMNNRIKDCIERASLRGTNFVLADATSFRWEKVFIFGPYTPVETVEKVIGQEWMPVREAGLDMSDAFCLLVFMVDRTVVRYSFLSRNYGDFAAVDGTNALSPQTAIFRVDSPGMRLKGPVSDGPPGSDRESRKQPFSRRGGTR